MIPHGLCARGWFRIVRIEAAVVAGNVDAVHGGIYPQERKLKVIAPQNAGAVSAFGVSIFQRERKR